MIDVPTMCTYCERSLEELLESGAARTPEEALQYVLIGDHRTVLCPDCIAAHAPPGAADPQKMLDGPITFPPGVTEMEHCCPELEARGLDEALACFTLHMERRHDYYVATCPHCGVTIRSLAEDEDL